MFDPYKIALEQHKTSLSMPSQEPYYRLGKALYRRQGDRLIKAGMTWEQYRQDADAIHKGANDGDDEAPCWDGYEMVGYKFKNGKKVPNCVPEG